MHSLILMVIDDNLEDREQFVEAVFEIDPAIQCFTAPDICSALKMLDEPKAFVPDIIFLDLLLPGFSGKNFLTEIQTHSKLKNIPVVVCSNISLSPMIEDCKRLGAAHFMRKPSHFNDLKKAIASALDQYAGEFSVGKF